MDIVRTLRTGLAGLGGAGAVRNAEAALLARRAEDEAIARLARRLTELDPPMRLEPVA